MCMSHCPVLKKCFDMLCFQLCNSSVCATISELPSPHWHRDQQAYVSGAVICAELVWRIMALQQMWRLQKVSQEKRRAKESDKWSNGAACLSIQDQICFVVLKFSSSRFRVAQQAQTIHCEI